MKWLVKCRRLAWVLGALVTTDIASAQHYPSRPIRLIMPFPAGGNADLLACTLAQRVGERLRQHIIIDNRASAGGILGAEIADLVSCMCPAVGTRVRR